MKGIPDEIFKIEDNKAFNALALAVFRLQFEENSIYRAYCDHLGITKEAVTRIAAIPYLPIQFFKSKTVLTGTVEAETVFSSSGTTGSITSKHHVTDITLYEKSFLKGFELHYGPVSPYCVLALLPSYLERSGSSLIYMANDFIQRSQHKASGFYLHNLDDLKRTLIQLEAKKTKTLLLGVSFALLDLAESFDGQLQYTVVMETGGMKGRRREMIREELHTALKNGLGAPKIHSEYGMTELLSQAYAKGDGIFECPPWMRVSTRHPEDPLSQQPFGKSGGINIIDLANVNSCSFIATQDLGKVYENGSFEVLGRFDQAEIRGCNLMVL